MRGAVVAGLLALALAPARPAFADDATHAPGFVLLPGFDRTSRIGLDVEDFDAWRPPGENDTRVVFHVQYALPWGLGAYVSWQRYVLADNHTAPTRNQVGALYTIPGSLLDGPDVRVVVHGGVGDGPPLPLQAAPSTVTIVDTGASILARAGDVYARLDFRTARSARAARRTPRRRVRDRRRGSRPDRRARS